MAAAVRYARVGARSVAELRRYLTRRGVASATAEAVIAQCRARGLLDDAACARVWAGHWARQGYAWRAIQFRLAQKGFAHDTVTALTRTMGRPSDDAARARELLAAGVGRRPASRRRAARALGARGFDAELIEQVLAAPPGFELPDADE